MWRDKLLCHYYKILEYLSQCHTFTDKNKRRKMSWSTQVTQNVQKNNMKQNHKTRKHPAGVYSNHKTKYSSATRYHLRVDSPDLYIESDPRTHSLNTSNMAMELALEASLSINQSNRAAALSRDFSKILFAYDMFLFFK